MQIRSSILILLFFQLGATEAITRFYDFTVELKTMAKLCKTKTIVTVNGQYPGPVIYGQEGDRIVVKVTNSVSYNVTIHWHGVRQLFSCWSDGPEYVTQCPIQTGHSFTYEFTLAQQKGTLWWHAHASWLRATVYGAIVVYPKSGTPYPFPHPYQEHIIILGEYWLPNVEDIAADIRQNGGGPPNADSYFINGHPGPLYNCSSQDMYVLNVKPGKTYLLRIINAALNNDHFFSIAKHKLTVVEADGEYTKPYETSSVFITPGQTINVLFTANQPYKHYYMGMSPYSPVITPLTTPALALLQYEGNIQTMLPLMPSFPAMNDTSFFYTYTSHIRSLATIDHPINVPQNIDRHLFFTVGLNLEKCPSTKQCQGINGGLLSASINNITFQLPTSTSILQAYYHNIPGIYTTNFPDRPPQFFDFVNNAPNNPTVDTQSTTGTRVSVLEFNSNVQIILQDTGIVSAESHPIHLHGFNFYVVGFGSGNYNAQTAKLNLKDPPSRNTFGVPIGGWAAIRFKADNPGVWFMHCHLEIHTSWGLSMAFIVRDGMGHSQMLPGPPADFPQC